MSQDEGVPAENLEQFRQILTRLYVEVEARLSDAPSDSDLHAITAAINAAAVRGFNLGAEVSRIAYRDALRRMEIPPPTLMEMPDVWLERYGGDDA